MPIHSLASLFGDLSTSQLVTGATFFGTIYALRVYAGGRKCTWERDWAGKMILIVAPPTPTILTLIDTLLQLPRPPHVLFLPPLTSPIPDDVLTLLHTMRLSAEKNPLAQLHCEPLPRTAEAVKSFAQKWSTAPQGTVGEGGRRIDAVVLGEGWEVGLSHESDSPIKSKSSGKAKGKVKGGKGWTTQQFHFHLITSLLPHLLRFPLERDVRVISLVSPTWSAALPSLTPNTNTSTPTSSSAAGSTTRVQIRDDLVQHTGRKSINTLFIMQHFQLILDTLASATRSKIQSATVPVPASVAGDQEKMEVNGGQGRKRDKSVKSNIMAVSVIMGWTREEVVRGVITSTLGYLFYILLYPFIWIFTPSAYMAIQPILFALQAPVRTAKLDDTPKIADAARSVDVRRQAVGGGDVVRDCAVVDVPPVLRDPVLAKAVYDGVEKEVEGGVKELEQGTKSKGEKAQ